MGASGASKVTAVGDLLQGLTAPEQTGVIPRAPMHTEPRHGYRYPISDASPGKGRSWRLKHKVTAVGVLLPGALPCPEQTFPLNT
jgi:hypothetical protein